MKYIITDKDEVRTGGMYHQDMAEDCVGSVTRAGHYRVNAEGKYEVYGNSIGYGIDAKPEDAIILMRALINNEKKT